MNHAPPQLRIILVTLALALSASELSAAFTPIKLQNQAFPLQDVRLLDGPFQDAMRLDANYLLSLEPDRLLAGFRLNAGLPAKAKIYGGWESRGISGQSLGHYLSACSHIYASTGDVQFKDRVSYCVNELTSCQQRSPDGFVGGMPRGVALFHEVENGDIRTGGGFDLNGGWVPWYNQHKLFAGLRDAYQVAGDEKAKVVLIKLGDWAASVCKNLSDAQMQKMLSVEQGGMMETLADLAAITGDTKYLDLAKRFWNGAVLDPLSRGRDELTGLHANTNIPKIIGAARLYELTGDEIYRKTAQTFWDAVVDHRSFVNGSNSDHEHFFKSGVEAGKLGPENGETCNVYNMLKLTAHLASWDNSESAADYDFYEKALYNDILASIDPDTGMCTYFQSMQPGRFKVYGTPFESFWCCTDTGMENHAKYGGHIYAHDDDSLFVNLFIASTLTWKEKGLTLTQQTDFPRAQSTTLHMHVDKPTELAIKIRVPDWAYSGISADGAATASAKAGEGYLTIDRTWNDGDIVNVHLPMTLHLHRAIDDPTSVAILDGPIVLAGMLGRDGMPETDNVPVHTVYDLRPVPVVPELVTDDTTLGWLKPVPNEPLHYRTQGVGQPADVSLEPYYAIHHQRYQVYFRLLSDQQFAQHKQEMADKAAAEASLAARTVDVVSFGEQQSEKDHSIESNDSNTGNAGGRPWRDAANGGYFSATMKVKPGSANILRCTYYGSDAGNRVFDISVDGWVVATQRLTAQHPDEFFDVDYPVPAEAIGDKSKVVIKFQAHPGAAAGGIFGCRMMSATP